MKRVCWIEVDDFNPCSPISVFIFTCLSCPIGPCFCQRLGYKQTKCVPRWEMTKIWLVSNMSSPKKNVVDDDLVWFSDIVNVLQLFKYFFHGWVEHGWNHQPTNMMLYDQDMTKIYYIPRVSDPTASQKFSSRHRIALFWDPVGKQTVEFQYPVFVDIATLISAWPVFRSRPILTSKRKCWRRLRALTHYFVVAECDGIAVRKNLSVIL